MQEKQRRTAVFLPPAPEQLQTLERRNPFRLVERLPLKWNHGTAIPRTTAGRAEMASNQRLTLGYAAKSILWKL